MHTSARNSKVIVILIISMAVAAAILLLLETPTKGWSPAGPLTAAYNQAVRKVTIEVVPPGAGSDPASYDCAIMPDGRCHWQPKGPDMRLAVFGASAEALGGAQARTLLQVLGSLNRTRGLDPADVAIAPQRDPRHGKVAAALRDDLCNLLLRKGILQ